MPRAQAWTRCAPASSAQSAFVTPRPRSWWPCQSILTPGSSSATTPADELHEVAHAVGRGVPDGVADADALGARADRRRDTSAEMCSGLRAGRVLGDVHDRQPRAHRERHRVLGEPKHPVEVPVLGVLADRRRADEAGHLDRDADLLGDLDDRAGCPPRRSGPRSWGESSSCRARSPAPGASPSPPRAGPRREGRCPPSRCRAPPSGAGCGSSGRRWGSCTEGDCRPSRRVSSSSSTLPRAGNTAPPARFQS